MSIYIIGDRNESFIGKDISIAFHEYEALKEVMER